MDTVPEMHVQLTGDTSDRVAGDNPERPVLLDLMSVGIYVNSLGELNRSPALRSRAERVLRRHLDAEHPLPVRAALVAVLESAA